MSRPKLTFFEKDVLDLTSRENVTITSSDNKSEDAFKVRDHNLKNQFVSEKKSKTFQDVEIEAEYLHFYSNGNEQKGVFKKTELTSGEPQIVKQAFDLREQVEINTQFEALVNKNKVLREETDACLSPDQTLIIANPFNYSLPLHQFHPNLRVQIGTLTYELIKGFEDYIDRVITPSGEDGIPPIDQGKLYSFIDYLNRSSDNDRVFASNFYGSLTDEGLENLDSLPTIREIDLGSVEKNINHNVNYTISKNSNKYFSEDITLPINLTGTYIEKSIAKIKSIGLRNGALGFLTQRETRIEDLNLGTDANFSRSGFKYDFSIDAFRNFSAVQSIINAINITLSDIRGSQRYLGESNGRYKFEFTLRVRITPESNRFLNLDFHETMGIVDTIGSVIREHSDVNGDLGTTFDEDSQDIIFKDEKLISEFSLPESDRSAAGARRQARRGVEEARRSILMTINDELPDEIVKIVTGLFNDDLEEINNELDISNLSRGDINSILNSISLPDRGSSEDLTSEQVGFEGNADILINQVDINQTSKSGSVRYTKISESKEGILDNQKFKLDMGFIPITNNLNLRSIPLVEDFSTLRNLQAINQRLESDPIELNFDNRDYLLNEIDSDNTSIFKLAERDDDDPDYTNQDIQRVTLTNLNTGRSSNYQGSLVNANLRTLILRKSSTGSNQDFKDFLTEELFNDNKLTFNDLRTADASSENLIRQAISFADVNLEIQLTMSHGLRSGEQGVSQNAQDNFDRCIEDAERARIEKRRIPVDLIERVDGSFPFVSVNAIRRRNNRLLLYLSRKTERAPAPAQNFFDSMQILGRTYNFMDANYRVIKKNTRDVDINNNPFPSVDVSQYSFAISEETEGNQIANSSNLNLIFAKSGTFQRRNYGAEKLIQKSTIETISEKQIDKVINGVAISSFDFDDNFFSLTFKGKPKGFSAVRIYDKEGNTQLIRDLDPVNAEITSIEGGAVYTWMDLPEFKILRDNKEYRLGILRGANKKEPKVFITSSGENGFSFLKDASLSDAGFQFNLIATNNAPSSFFHFKLQNETKDLQIASLPINSLIKTGEKYIANQSIELPDLNDKLKFIFKTERLPVLDISFMKLTHIYFDTIVLLNTNILDISLVNTLGNSLVHHTDIKEFKSVKEGGERHLVLFLKNPISSMEVKLRNYLTNDSSDQRKIGRVMLLKTIGSFSQYPFVSPSLNLNKVVTRSQFSNYHVKSNPSSINYQLTFPPLANEDDVALAQDLFSRSSDFDEFVVWTTSGNLPQRKNIRGFRFKDLIKSLCSNEMEFNYSDGRFSSGVQFEMSLVQVI